MNPPIFVAVPIRGADGTVVATDTVRYDQFVRKLLKAETAKEEIYHILAGIVGEIGELASAESDENIKEELGDLWFYTQAWLNHYNLTAADVAHIEPSCENELVLLSLLSDVVKKEYTYRKPRDHVKVLQATAELLAELEVLESDYDLSQPEILQANAEKLCERYKNLTYSNEEAIARADKHGKED